MIDSIGFSLGNRNGEEIEMDDGPLSKESGSHKQPGLPIRSMRYSLNIKTIVSRTQTLHENFI